MTDDETILKMELERARTCKLVTLPETQYVDCDKLMPQKGFVGNVYYVSENISDEIEIDIYYNGNRCITMPLKMHKNLNSILERYPSEDKIPLVWFSAMFPMNKLNDIFIHANTKEKWGIQYDYWPDDDSENSIVSTLYYTRFVYKGTYIVPFNSVFVIIKPNSTLLISPKIKHYTSEKFSDTFELEDNVYIAPLIPDIYDVESLKCYLLNKSNESSPDTEYEFIDIFDHNGNMLTESIICFVASSCKLMI